MRFSVLAAVWLVLAGGMVHAQNASATAGRPEPADAERMAWQRLRGTAIDLSVGADGAAFALDHEGQVWLRRSGSNAGWIRLPGKFSRIDAAHEKLAWAVDANGALFRYNGTLWREIADVKALDVGTSPAGQTWVVLVDGTLAHFDARQDKFVAEAGAPLHLVRVDVDERGLPWVLGADGAPQRFDGRVWVKLPGVARDLSVGPDGTAYIVSAEHEPMRWVSAQSRWQKLLARADVVAAGADGNPWIATPDGEIFAHQPDSKPGMRAQDDIPQVFTQVLSWRRVRGSGKQLAISPRGDVAALGENGEIWQWTGKDSWTRVPGRLAMLAIEPGGLLWGVDEDGRIVRQGNGGWKEMPGRARLLAVGADGSAWIVGGDGRLARWQPAAGEWQTLEGNPAKMLRLAVDPVGRPWVVRDNGTVAQYDGKQWVDVPGIEATDLAIGPEGSVFAVAGALPWRYNRLNKRWEQLTGEVERLAVGPGGRPWAVTEKHDIYATAFFNEERATAAASVPAPVGGATATTGAVTTIGAPPATSGAAAAARDPLGPGDFRLVPAVAAQDIAIGNEGSVFIVVFDGTLARWSNTRNAFIAFPGQFARIAVAPDGKPWGVTVRGEVYRHDGTSWRVIYNIVAQDIAIAANGTVMVAGTDETLYRYNADRAGFDRVLPAGDNVAAPTGSRIALDPRGRPWTLTKDYRLWRCDRTPCELQAIAARDIHIGPDGSVLVADADRKLRRLNPATGQWDFVNVAADVVAVGPGGRPWIIDGRSQVWSSAFFRRDESNDLGVAASSTSNTTTTTTPVFTFTVAMRFDAVTLPVGFDNNPVPPVVLAVGLTGQISMIDASFQFWAYNTTRGVLTADTKVPALPWTASGTNSVRALVFAADGSYWISNKPQGQGASVGVWRLQGGRWVQVQGLADCASTPGCSTPAAFGLAPAPDGTMYATSEGGNLYRFDNSLQRFVRVNIPPPNANPMADIAVGPNGHLWATTRPGTNPAYAVTYEFDGVAWVVRAAATGNELNACLSGLSNAAPCVAIGANGAVYQPWNSRLRRRNASAGQWDAVSNSPSMGSFTVDADGRPWVWDGATTLYKAR